MTVNALYFSATWCGPCKTFKPVAMADLDSAGIPVIEYDADIDFEKTTEYDVRSLPSIIFTRDGEVIARVVGASKKQLDESIRRTRIG